MNIILVGLTGSGKTSVGRELAYLINSRFVDLDDMIRLYNKRMNEYMSVQEIFKKYGENYFRNLENEAVLQVVKMNGCVIAIGGGTLENKNNAEILKKSGKIVFLDVDINILIKRADPSRPIFKGDPRMALKEMQKKRMRAYRQFSDIVIDASSYTIEGLASYIAERIR